MKFCLAYCDVLFPAADQMTNENLVDPIVNSQYFTSYSMNSGFLVEKFLYQCSQNITHPLQYRVSLILFERKYTLFNSPVSVAEWVEHLCAHREITHSYLGILPLLQGT